MSDIRQVLSHRQIQQTVLKPKMLQSLKLLTMTRMELEQFLKTELTGNPLLNLEEFDPEAPDEDPAQENSEDINKDEKEDGDTKAEETSEVSEDEKETITEANELSEIL
ncbi:MAG: RNA polymerase sigma-54 factor, partial [Candidatus Zophobacter franzmannii]|nr:RNA polymerase sigma-54 factor [Candidatus Zophobacter franzmannii]